jgi:hypothetical protein
VTRISEVRTTFTRRRRKWWDGKRRQSKNLRIWDGIGGELKENTRGENFNLTDSLGGYSPASQCGGPGSNPDLVMWDLLWTERHWGRFSPGTSVSPSTHSFHSGKKFYCTPKQLTCFVRFEVFKAVTMNNVVFWDVTMCGSCNNRHFGGN